MSGKRGSRDEGNEDEEGILEVPPAECLKTLTTVSTAPANGDRCVATITQATEIAALTTEVVTLKI